MARFFFKVCHEGQEIIDQDAYCDSIGSAYQEAKRLTKAVVDGYESVTYPFCTSWIEVQYADRSPLLKLPFGILPINHD